MTLLSRIGAAYEALASGEPMLGLNLKAVYDESPLSDPSPWLARSFGGLTSAAGKSVTPESAMRTSTVYACVSVLAESAAQIPCVLFKRTSDGDAVPAVDHPLYPLLLNMPNPEMTAQDSTEMSMNHLLLRGNAFNQIVRSAGEVVELNPLHPDHVRMFRSSVSGDLLYEYTPPQGGSRIFQKSEIWRQIGKSFNGITGVSPLSYARESIGLALAVEEHGAKLFANGAQLATAFEHPAVLSEEAYKRLVDSLNDRFAGSQNAFRSIVLEDGLKVSKLAMTSVDSQFIEARKFQVEEICRVFRVPPHMVQDLARATFNNIEHLSINFVNSSLMPWLVRREQSILRDLLLPNERKKYFVRHDVDSLQRGDMNARANYYASGIANTWLSPNEARAAEGRNKRPDGAGDKFENPNTSSGKEKPGLPVPDPQKG